MSGCPSVVRPPRPPRPPRLRPKTKALLASRSLSTYFLFEPPGISGPADCPNPPRPFTHFARCKGVKTLSSYPRAVPPYHSHTNMACHLARIHGTEEDRVNCPFYFKIGVCRHGDRCSRHHHKPAFSQTVLIKHIYRHPIREAELNAARMGQSVDGIQIDEAKAKEDFLSFYE